MYVGYFVNNIFWFEEVGFGQKESLASKQYKASEIVIFVTQILHRAL